MIRKTYQSRLLQYLAEYPSEDSLPTLEEMSQQLEISMAKLREQLEAARVLGVVDIRPRTGITRKPYSFYPAVQQSLRYAITQDWTYFKTYSSLRKHIEAAYWEEAAGLLTQEDRTALQTLMGRAWEKLNGSPVVIPHEEHRQLHLGIFRRLQNPFVMGLLEAFWDAYEAVGLNLYSDYQHLLTVWRYHQKMVDALCEGDIAAGYQAFIAHTDLLYHHAVAPAPEIPVAQAPEVAK